jgi:serine protease inhibitor
MSSRLRISVLSAAMFSAACGDAMSSVQVADTAQVAEALPRALTAGEHTLIAAENDFAFSFFAQVSAAESDSDVFTSPLSASMALSMAMNGAASATYAQMRSALSLDAASETEINDGYKSLITLLREIDPAVDFRLANSIWHGIAFPFNQSFIDAGKNSFDTQVGGLDFASPSAAQAINAWASTATGGSIPTIVDRTDTNQAMLLVDATFFLGSWSVPFDPLETHDAPFRGVAGDRTVKQMHRSGTMRYFSSSSFEAVDLPYGNGAFVMTVVLPRAGKTMDATIALFRGGGWSSLTPQLRDLPMDLYLPRFNVAWERMLNDDLQALGIRDAFSPAVADFTRMSARGRELSLSVVKQKSFVEVNEVGTQAATISTEGDVLTTATHPVVMRVERPFLFVIRERLSGTILFIGKIVRL